MSGTVLIVDDEPPMARAMAVVLERAGYRAVTASSAEAGLERLARGRFDLVITDLRLPGGDGCSLLERCRLLYPRLPVVVVTAYASVDSAVACMRAGAGEYLQKPFAPEALEQVVARLLRERRSAQPQDVEAIVAEDPATRAALELALRAARAEATVLLEAESGAGKEVFARLIHRESARAKGPFVAVNCAALPRELLEAELFGYCRGAFTGAVRDRRGYFQLADGGTLLLDEIGEMSPELQARLLRVLQDRSVQPVGAEAPVQVDVRVVAATNRNLKREVAEGRFREDLYYRLCVLRVTIPPLRERPADIAPLAWAFARRFAGPQATLTAAALAKLEGHRWPGNVRELENVIQRAAVLSGGARIDAEHLELDMPRAEPAPSAPRSLEEAEREAIRLTLLEVGGNRTKAAERLGISPRTLRHKLKRYRDLGVPVVEAYR